MSPIRFGTDGWRAVIARDYTFDNVALCAQGVADYVKEAGLAHRGLIVGYDTRFASEEFAREVAQVLAGNGIPAHLSDRPCPTPVASFSITARGTGGAVIITASHNPPLWNGFKFRPEYAGSAPPEVIARIEEFIDRASSDGVRRMPLSRAGDDGLVREFDPRPGYLSALSSLADVETIRRAGLNIVVDAMFGAGAGYIPALVGDGTTTVSEIHAERNPIFPGMAQPEPVARNLGDLMRHVPATGADVGIALDGDADRLGVVDEKGNFLTPLQVLSLLALYVLEVKGERGAIVKTVTTSDMLFKLGAIYGVPVIETPVGFKYVGPEMVRHGAVVGGEESGGYTFRGHIPERDGILSGLYFLHLMVATGKRPSELVEHLYSRVGPHHYSRRDVHFDEERRRQLTERLRSLEPDSIGGLKVQSVIAVDGKKFRLSRGWVMARFSGTEPLLRIYAEAESPDRVERIIDDLSEMLGL